MPNWVFNTLNDYPKDVYEKYKGDNGDIDFNKLIPEPEEITNTVSGGAYDKTAKNIAKYNDYIINKDNDNNIQYDYNNPLKDDVNEKADFLSRQMGDLVIENPDESLNTLLQDEKNKMQKEFYDEYVEIFGNRACRHIESEDFRQVYSNYIQYQENEFKKTLESDKPYFQPYKQYNSLDDMGRKLIELKEKYGADNWYDWRLANWGTKWNAAEPKYIEDCNTLTFNTAWSIPYPLLNKMTEENPDVKIEGYSEEETGWFDEYNLNNGQINLTATGEITYDEETDKDSIDKEEFNPPKTVLIQDGGYKLIDQIINSNI